MENQAGGRAGTVPNVCDEDLPVPAELRSRHQLRAILEAYLTWVEADVGEILVGRGDRVTMHRRTDGPLELVTARYRGDRSADHPSGEVLALRDGTGRVIDLLCLTVPGAPVRMWCATEVSQLAHDQRLHTRDLGTLDSVAEVSEQLRSPVLPTAGVPGPDAMMRAIRRVQPWCIVAAIVVAIAALVTRSAELRQQPAIDVVEELLRPGRAAVQVFATAGIGGLVTAAAVGSSENGLVTAAAGLGVMMVLGPPVGLVVTRLARTPSRFHESGGSG